MSEVKRFNCMIEGMKQDALGDWVTIERYQAIEAQRDELLEALKELCELEGSEQNEWDAVDRLIPAMTAIAKAAIAKCEQK